MHARYGGGHSCLVQVFCCCCLNLVFAAAQLQVVHDEHKGSDHSDLYYTSLPNREGKHIYARKESLTNHNYMNGKEISNAGKFMQPIIGRCSVFLFLWELVFLFLDTVIYNNVHGVVRTHD